MKRHIFAAALLWLSFSLLACNRGQEESGRPRVALVLKTLNNPFFIDMETGAQEAAERLGVQLIVQAAERELDVEKQMQIIENLIQTKIDALCITPSGSKEVIPAILKANQAGIPVLILDTRVDQSAAQEGARFETFIGSDNYQGGRVAGQFILERLGSKAKVAILEGIPGHETGDARLRGFKDAVKDAENVEVVSSQPANWERDQGFNVFQNILEAHPEVDTLFACSDLMALGAMEAVAAAGRSGEIRIVGFDALEEARQAVREGTMLATVAQFPADMGRIAIESAVRVLKGEKVPAHIPVRIELITRQNVDSTQKGPALGEPKGAIR
ncbi:MAG: sugar ABC transporter substrate-binding protein [Acidobacteriota bacterium]